MSLTLDLHKRSFAPEMMDDLSITDARLTVALDELRYVNRLLGGYSGTMSVLGPWIRQQGKVRSLTVLDVGSGVADFPEYLARWSDRYGFTVHSTAVDLNPVTVAYAESSLRKRLPDSLAASVSVVQADALNLPFEDGAFDVVVTSLFLHHFEPNTCAGIIREMDRVSRYGWVVNDLHRHALALLSIQALAALFSSSAMFRHDGPQSVRRAFTRRELDEIMQLAGVGSYTLRWHWAFRWVASTLIHEPVSC